MSQTFEIETEKTLSTSPKTNPNKREKNKTVTRSQSKSKPHCDLCKRDFCRPSDLKKHNESVHFHNAKDHAPKFEEVADLSTIYCKTCDSKFDSRTRLKQHVKEMHNIIQPRNRRRNDQIEPSFFCDVCNKGYTRKYDMEIHRNKLHPDEPIPGDNIQKNQREENKCFYRKCSVVEDNGETIYKCDICDRSFTEKYNLLRHRTIHTGDKSYCCQYCGKSFRVTSGLIRHINDCHLKIKKIQCELCSRKFTTRANRDEHMNIHTGTRPFVCDICGKAFKQKASLYSHNLYHKNVFKYHCTVCGKRYRRSQELKVHSWLHTGYKPYNCGQCKASFRLSHDFKRHMRTHNKVSECVCKECGSVFSQERYLRVHSKIHQQISIESDSNLN